jgi:hypothetical protein
MSWVNLDALRARIADATKAEAEISGLENVRVFVRIEEQSRSFRAIHVEICASMTTEDAEYFQGRPWQDN